MERHKVAIIAPVHRRHRFLRLARRQFRRIPDSEVRIFYFADRPTPRVEDIIYEDTGTDVAVMPWPIVSGNKGDFPRAWQWQMEWVLARWEPDFLGIWDDDMVLSDPEEVPALLETGDLIYGPKLFVWDDVSHYNRRLEHNSSVFFRRLDGDIFHSKSELQVHAPQRVHASEPENIRTLKSFILDYGFMSQDDRLQVFNREKRTGKIDGFTLPLVSEPDLGQLPDALLTKSLEFSLQFDN